MANVIWKEGTLISIAIGDGGFVLAEMLKSPYLLIYDDFRKDNCWNGANLNEIPILFCHAVTKQFLKFSEVKKQNIHAIKHNNLPKHWISITPNARKIVVWKGTEQEKEIIIIGEGGKLVEEDIYRSGFQEEKIIIPSISFTDNKTIDNHELTNIAIFPEFNERLYLCYKLRKNIDPYKDLVFNRPLLPEYKKYIEIISS